jgi:hypothetical protein
MADREILGPLERELEVRRELASVLAKARDGAGS